MGGAGGREGDILLRECERVGLGRGSWPSGGTGAGIQERVPSSAGERPTGPTPEMEIGIAGSRRGRDGREEESRSDTYPPRKKADRDKPRSTEQQPKRTGQRERAKQRPPLRSRKHRVLSPDVAETKVCGQRWRARWIPCPWVSVLFPLLPGGRGGQSSSRREVAGGTQDRVELSRCVRERDPDRTKAEARGADGVAASIRFGRPWSIGRVGAESRKPSQGVTNCNVKRGQRASGTVRQQIFHFKFQACDAAGRANYN